MAKFLFKLLPEKEEFQAGLKKNYPEINSTDLYAHVWLRLLSSTVEEHVESFLKKYEMSSGRFMILMILEFRPEGMKPSEIATYLSITQATVTGLIDGLIQNDLVVKKGHAKDGRACVISLTEKGHQFMTKVRPEFTTTVCKVYSPLSHDEKMQFIGLMEKIFKSFNVKPDPL